MGAVRGILFVQWLKQYSPVMFAENFEILENFTYLSGVVQNNTGSRHVVFRQMPKPTVLWALSARVPDVADTYAERHRFGYSSSLCFLS